MKKLIVLIFVLLFFMPIFAQSDFSDTDDYAFTFFKKLNETQNKLTYMNKSGALEKIGTETVKGDISGTLYYSVKIKGLGAVVVLRYTNYSDEAGWTYDGELFVYSNMVQDGTLGGFIEVTGDFPGLIDYENVQIKNGKPCSGYYLVSRSGKQAERVDYKVYLKSKE